jgi:hypothetical protein
VRARSEALQWFSEVGQLGTPLHQSSEATLTQELLASPARQPRIPHLRDLREEWLKEPLLNVALGAHGRVRCTLVVSRLGGTAPYSVATAAGSIRSPAVEDLGHGEAIADGLQHLAA